MKTRNILFWLIYYGILMIAMVSWQEAEPPDMTRRLAFLAVSIIPPIVFNKVKTFPLIIFLFYTVNIYGTALSYYPTYIYYYLGIVALGLILIKKQDRRKNKLTYLLLCLALYIFIVDLVASYEVLDSVYCYLIILLLSYYYTEDDSLYVLLFQYVFVFSSFVLAIEYFTVGKDYVQLYSTGIEREYWMDPNYFASVMGMGAIQSFLLLMNKEKKNRFVSLFLVATIILSIMTLVLVASRGALLATTISIALYLLVSDSKRYIKIITVILAAFFLIFLYNNNYFELIQERVFGGDTTGSGRTSIWKRKLNAFTGSNNVFHMIFGMGNTEAMELAFGYRRGFHNDFLSFLISYGLIGFCLFIASLIRPLLNVTVYKKEVIAGLLYLLICCMILEPLTGGYLPYFAFYFSCILMSQVKRKEIV